MRASFTKQYMIKEDNDATGKQTGFCLRRDNAISLSCIDIGNADQDQHILATGSSIEMTQSSLWRFSVFSSFTKIACFFLQKAPCLFFPGTLNTDLRCYRVVRGELNRCKNFTFIQVFLKSASYIFYFISFLPAHGNPKAMQALWDSVLATVRLPRSISKSRVWIM